MTTDQHLRGFQLSDEHAALGDAARDLLAARCDTDALRAALDHGSASLPVPVLAEMADLGWLGIAVDPDLGGSGGDLLTAVVLAEHAGRALAPGPLRAVIGAGLVLDRFGPRPLRASLLPALCAGEATTVTAWEEPHGRWGPGATTATAVVGEPGGLVLDGVKVLVPDALDAAAVVVAVRLDGEAALVHVPTETAGVTRTPMRTIDGGAAAEVVFDSVRVAADAVVARGRDVDAAYDLETLLAAAELLGVADESLARATQYAKDRVQFGRPIGAFQAIAHQLADIAVDVEIGRSLVLAATVAHDDAPDEAAELTSAAKAWLSEAAVRATEVALHVHGGIGFTWELDIHLFLRRARALAATFGDSAHHRERIAAILAGRLLDGESPSTTSDGPTTSGGPRP
jgi:alkylation response protein AidB-like acyl-CoA dehydrogenase